MATPASKGDGIASGAAYPAVGPILGNCEASADGSSLIVGDASAFFGGIQAAGGAANGSQAIVALAPVPEPGTLVLLVAGAALLARLRSRRRS